MRRPGRQEIDAYSCGCPDVERLHELPLLKGLAATACAVRVILSDVGRLQEVRMHARRSSACMSRAVASERLSG